MNLPIEYWSPSALRFHPRWQKPCEAGLTVLAEHFQLFGFGYPISVNANHVIETGNSRVFVALRYGFANVPVVLIAGLPLPVLLAYVVGLPTIDHKERNAIDACRASTRPLLH